MRFESIRAKGLGVFRDEIAIDLAALPGRLTAVVGPNGAGKSSLLELLFAGAQRDTPTRGSLVDLARDRDAFLEVKLVNGATHTLRHTVDAISKKSEALVLDAEGAPVLPTTSVKAFDEWARAHLPPREVVLASLFAAQQTAGFCDLSPRERKACLSRLLGIEELESIAERSRKRANEAREALSGVLGEERALPLEDVGRLEIAVTDARTEVGRAEAAHAEARGLADAAIVYRGKAAALIALRAELADVDQRIANNRKVLDEADAIGKAVAKLEQTRDEIAKVRASVDDAAREATEVERRRREALRRAHEARDVMQAAKAKQEAARGRLSLRPEIERAREALPAVEERADELVAEIAGMRKAIEDANGKLLGGANKRLEWLRQALNDIAAAHDLQVAQGTARTALVIDDRAIEEHMVAPGRIERLKTTLREMETELHGAQATATSLGRLVAREGELAAAEREIAEISKAIEGARSAEEEAAKEALRLDGSLTLARNTLASMNAHVAELEDRVRQWAPIARRAENLAQAETRLAERTEQRAGIVDRITVVEAELAALPEPGEIDVAGAEAAVRSAHAIVGRLEGQLAAAKKAEERRAELSKRRADLELDVADWALLGEDLGASGLPALLIDAAGPELTALVNDLLHTCVGTRFTVAIETTRPSADGKKAIETCDVRVTDTVGGRDAEVGTFSGGERVLVSESVSLALTMLACRRSGIEGPTLVRDETGAALDPENARNYVAMIRRASEIVGASRVLMVSHSPEIQELADGRIVVEDGRVSVS